MILEARLSRQIGGLVACLVEIKARRLVEFLAKMADTREVGLPWGSLTGRPDWCHETHGFYAERLSGRESANRRMGAYCVG